MIIEKGEKLMDITSLKLLCENILPILGAVALIFVIILLNELIKVVKSANGALDKGTGTIEQVNESLKKVQAPLDSAVKVAGTIDKAHDATLKGISDAKDFVVKNASEIKEKVNEVFTKEEVNKDEEIKEPSPEDIIGGK